MKALIVAFTISRTSHCSIAIARNLQNVFMLKTEFLLNLQLKQFELISVYHKKTHASL